MPLSSALDRLEDLVREESDALRSRTPMDFAEVSRRKSRCLLELSRVARAVPMPPEPGMIERVGVLREALTKNLELLAIHLAAAQEVGAIIQGAIRDAESDGTYSASLAHRNMAT